MSPFRILVATDFSNPIVLEALLAILSRLKGRMNVHFLTLTIALPQEPCDRDISECLRVFEQSPMVDLGCTCVELSSFEECKFEQYDATVVPTTSPSKLVDDMAILMAQLLGSPGVRGSAFPDFDSFSEPLRNKFSRASTVRVEGSIGQGDIDNAHCRIPVLHSEDERVSVGRFTYGPAILRMWRPEDRIHIGSFTSIAQDVRIFGGGEHFTHDVTTYPLRMALGDPLADNIDYPTRRGETSIGCDVWIGDRATVMSGVTVGHGAVIGAGSVVSRDVPPYAIVIGNPSRVKGFRFDREVVRDLLDIAWWDWPLERIQDGVPLLSSGRVEEFIRWAKSSGP